MRLPELKRYFKNKYTIRIVAGVLTVALIGSGVSVYSGRNGEVARAAISSETTESADSGDAEIALDELVTRSESEVDKEETVYLLSDASGNVEQTIVMDHLYNTNKDATIQDKTNLTDITNVKGKETFEQSGDKIIWQADGKDIYYRGSQSQEAPVAQKVTYYLDDKEITPEELAGKSGRVTIHYEYENTSSFTETLNGEEVRVAVPFTAITALMLDDHFSNVEVTNGKVKENGTSKIVIGYALPGLKDSLNVEDNDFTGDVDLPEYFEVSADVENFSLETAMTVVMNATDLTDINGLDTSSMDDKIEELEDASGQLEDGSGELADGMDTLQNSLGDFAAGMKSLSDGLSGYTDGASQINDGLGKVKKGVDTLNGSKKTLSDGVTKLKDGADSAADGASQLAAGYQGDGTAENPGLLKGTKSLSSGAKTLAGGIDTLAQGITGDGTAKNPGLLNGTKSLSVGAKSLASGVDQLVAGMKGDGTAANPGLLQGAKSLSEGAATVDENMKTLAAGAAQLDAGVDQVAATMTAMPETMETRVQKMLDQNLNENTSVKGLLENLGVSSVTTKNLDDVTAKVVSKKDAIITAMIDGAIQTQLPEGMTLEMLKADDAVYQTYAAKAAPAAESAYAELIAGLYQAQGAMLVVDQTENMLQSEENKNQIKALTEGSESLKTNAQKLQKEGTAVVRAGASGVSNGITQVSDGVKQLDSGSDELSAGAAAVYSGVTSLNGGVKQLDSGSDELSTGADTIYGGVKKLSQGTTQLSQGLNQLDKGVGSLYKKMPELKNGIGSLKKGVDKLALGSDTLVSKNKDLLDGMQQLMKGTGDLVDGVGKLDDGSHELADGMAEFNEKAIDKLVNSYRGDVKSLVNRIQAVLDAGHEYQSYTDVADGQTGSVKFIYKLSPIDSDEK